MAKQIKKYSKIALIVGLSIALVTMYFAAPSAQAGNLTDREIRISDSRLGATNVYYDFLATDIGGNIRCIQVQFCDETDIGGACTAPNNMDTQNASTTATTTVFDWNNLEETNWDLYSTTSNTLVASTTVVAGEDLGTAGSFVIGGITNSDATSTYYAWIRTYSDADCSSLSTEVDRGVVAYAMLSGVTVTAVVAETLNVTVNASTCADFITGGDTVQASATTSINYGTITTENFYDSCQRLDIGTNASNGYIARIHKTQQLTSAGSDVIGDGVCDGGGSPCGTSTEEVWQTNTNNGFAYCMRDKDSNTAATADAGWGTNYCGQSAASQYFKTISNGASSSEAMMQSNTATSTLGAWIGYRLSVDSAQIAGTYTTEIIYTVTPKY